MITYLALLLFYFSPLLQCFLSQIVTSCCEMGVHAIDKSHAPYHVRKMMRGVYTRKPSVNEHIYTILL